MEQVLVTVVTPVLNIIAEGRTETLIGNFESVHAQTYGNIEHLIIDGASTDGTIEILEDYAKKGWIRYISEKDKGLYDAMNKGIDAAKGEYILILNSDDKFISNTAIADSIEAIQREKADFSYAKARCVDSYGNETPMPNCYAPDLSHVFTEMPCSHQTMLCHKRMFLNNKFMLDLPIGADYEWLLKSCINGMKPVFVDSFISEYHRGGNSDRLKNFHKYIDERVDIFYRVFHEVDHSITKYDCEMNFFEQYSNDKIWNCITSHVTFPVLRGYADKSENPKDLIPGIWKIAAKNAMLINLMQTYFKQVVRGNTLADILRSKGFCRCAIYGFGSVGQCVLTDLQVHDFQVDYVIDKSYDGFLNNDSLDCKIINLDGEIAPTDVIIVTPVFYFEEIYRELKDKVTCPIVALDDFIQP